MKGFIRAMTLALFVTAPQAFSEDEMRDFYAEPGMNPFKTSAGQDVTEHIDPFTGNVQLSYVDLSIPGNGGLDINIARYYNLPQSSPGYANPFGYGWTMHFGRITIGSGHASQLCGTGLAPGGDTLDNPSIEMPTGGRELLVHSSVLNDGTYITKSNWKAECIDPTDYTRGIVVTAPDGTAYYMREYVFMQGEDGPAGEAAPTVETWLTNQIVDSYGNTIDLTYLGVASGMKLLTRIDASDGRVVTLDYLDASNLPVTAGSVNARLSTIKANGQTWEYRYAPFSGGATGWGFVDHYELTEVLRPDGTIWNYEYGSTATEPEYQRLTRVTYPAGGEINYSYQRIRPYLPNPDFSIYAIQAKTQTNPGRPVGSWTYEFYPGAVDFADLGVQPVAENAGRLADFTRITTPEGVEHIYHVGYWALVGTHDILWEMGLKIRHQYLAVDPADGSLSAVRSVSNSWSFRAISDEVYRGGILSDLWDSRVYTAQLASQTMVLDGYGYTSQYTNYDDFGNPGTTTQYSIYPTENGDRITDVSYRNDIAGWFIGLPETETTSQNGSVIGTLARTYNALGRLQSEDRFGVTTLYAYHPQGDLAAVTDARGSTTNYSNYYRGTAQLEELPDGSQRSSAVNHSGSVASRTTGTGNTTSFTYDGLNRLTGIDYPIGSDVSIDWNATGKVLQRGVYQESVDWDGFGREIRLTRKDLASGDSYSNTFDYDESGRKVFASDVNSSNGVGWEYDVIGRIVRTINQDGTSRSVTHEGAHRELHRDENSNVVDYRYQVYGAPENRYLNWTIAPEGVATRIWRDAYGNITGVFQGGLDPDNAQQYLGYIQTYGYNTRLQLTSIDSPADIGLTTYGRDMLGNLISRQVGASGATSYAYDAMNRLEMVDYPGTAPDVSYSYDADGRVKAISNSNAARTYDYNENGNLVGEDIVMDGASYALAYTLDDLDHLSTLTYPSGRTLDYAPDALGRPSQAMPYLTSVSYHPDGSPWQLSYANGRTTHFTRTSTNRLDTIAVSGLVDLDYDYDAAGNVRSMQDLLNPATNRSMSYDGLHRLKSVDAGWDTSLYEYDEYSNLTRKSDPARSNRSQHYQYLGLMLNQISYDGAAAQRGFSYDDYGNTSYSDDAIYDVFTGLPQEVRTTRRHVFDDAGNMVFSRRSARDELDNIDPSRSGSFSSEYDGKNNRIRKINHSDNNRITEYIYSDDGLLRGEYDEAGTYYGNEYFYLGNRQIATAKVNSPPLVAAIDDIQTYGGLTVALSATHSDVDGEVVAIAWAQVSGPEVTIDNPTSSSTSFTAPSLSGESTIVLDYTVTDDRGAQATQQLTVLVAVNHPPVAHAGSDVTVLAGASAQLNGSGSSDPEGAISYNWSGSYLADSAVANPVIELPERGFNYSENYTLTVTDSLGATATDTVTVDILTLREDIDQDGLPDGWEIINFGDTTSFGGQDDPDGDGVVNAQELAEGTSPTVADAPQPVTRLGVVQGDGGNVLVWERTAAAAQFNVYWTNEPGLPLDAWNQASATQRFFEHAGLTNGVTYHYTVAALNAMGSAAQSPVVSGAPDPHSWQPAQRQPDAVAGFDASSTWLATNRFGDTAILAEKYEESVYRLYVWQRAAFDDWGGQELVSEDCNPHSFAQVAIDDSGNLLVAWAGGAVGSRNLYAVYRPYAKAFGARETVENYSADNYVDGDVVGLSHLEFAYDGTAYACWRQNRLHSFNNLADTSGATALVKKFSAISGWSGEHNLEVLNNVGDTLNLSCDVSGDGHVVAAWERYNSYDPQSVSLDSMEYDVWVAAFNPDGTWTPSESVEFIKDGIREESGAGIQNHLPRAAVGSQGRAAVIWHNASDANIEVIEYEFSTSAWLPQETLESRTRQIPGGNTHQLASNDNGDLLAAWGDRFTVKPSGDASWARSKSLAGPATHLGIDQRAQPYSIHIAGADVIASRYIGGAWTSQSLNEAVDVAAKAVLGAGAGATDALLVHWLSGPSLLFSSDQPGVPAPPGNTPPIANAGTAQTVFESTSVQLDGSASYDPDDAIASFSWEQVSGSLVSLSGAATPQPGFVAPSLSVEEDLVFRLTVADQQGLSDSATVTIRVLDDAPDTTPPVTTFSTQTERVKGAKLDTITLQSNETATTYFRFIGQGVISAGGADTSSWQTYTQAVVIQLDKSGTGDFEFYSEDFAGNLESTQLEILQ
jgi:YD repeat-containing protein